MSDRTVSVFMVGAFAAALSVLSVTPASAQEFTAAQKKIQAEHTALVKSGKLEPCFGTALKGQNDCYAGRRNHVCRHQHRRLSRQCVQAGAEGNLHHDFDAERIRQSRAQGLRRFEEFWGF